MPQFVLDHRQQIEVVDGPRVDRPLLAGNCRGSKFFIPGWRRIDKPVMSSSVDIQQNLLALRQAQIRARQIADDKLDLREFRQGGSVQPGARR